MEPTKPPEVKACLSHGTGENEWNGASLDAFSSPNEGTAASNVTGNSQILADSLEESRDGDVKIDRTDGIDIDEEEPTAMEVQGCDDATLAMDEKETERRDSENMEVETIKDLPPVCGAEITKLEPPRENDVELQYLNSENPIPMEADTTQVEQGDIISGMQPGKDSLEGMSAAESTVESETQKGMVGSPSQDGVNVSSDSPSQDQTGASNALKVESESIETEVIPGKENGPAVGMETSKNSEETGIQTDGSVVTPPRKGSEGDSSAIDGTFKQETKTEVMAPQTSFETDGKDEDLETLEQAGTMQEKHGGLTDTRECEPPANEVKETENGLPSKVEKKGQEEDKETETSTEEKVTKANESQNGLTDGNTEEVTKESRRDGLTDRNTEDTGKDGTGEMFLPNRGTAMETTEETTVAGSQDEVTKESQELTDRNTEEDTRKDGAGEFFLLNSGTAMETNKETIAAGGPAGVNQIGEESVGVECAKDTSGSNADKIEEQETGKSHTAADKTQPNAEEEEDDQELDEEEEGESKATASAEKKEKSSESEDDGWDRPWRNVTPNPRNQPVQPLPKQRSWWSTADTDDYLNRYPDKEDNPHLKANVEFYMNKTKSKPDGDYIDQIHKKWKSRYDLLEQHHGYIQWLFPIRESGLNWHAQELQLHEAEAICKDKKAHARVLKSYEMMLGFYGMKLKDPKTGTIERADNWRERYSNLNRSMHNYLRITRILKCLGELGYEHLKEPFVRFCIREAFETGQLRNVAKSCREYWIYVIRDEEQQRELEDLVFALSTCK